MELDFTLASTKFPIEDKSFTKRAQPTHHSIILPSTRINFFEEKSNKSVSIFSPTSFRVSRNKSVLSSPHCSKPLTCSSVEIIDLTNHHQNFHRLPSLQQILKILTDPIYCTKDFDSNQSNSKYANMICTTKFRQLIGTYQYYNGLFEDTYNQHWIITVFQLSNIIYYIAVSLSTEKIQSDICQYNFRFKSHLSTKKTTAQYQTNRWTIRGKYLEGINWIQSLE